MSTTGKWAELFDGRMWRVAEEVSGPVEFAGTVVIFARGLFELPAGSAFRSPLSTNLGRRGVVLQETDAAGSTDVPGSRLAVGAASVQKARKQYSAVW